MAEKTLSEILSNFVYELSFQHLPPEAVEKAKISIADGIACAFAGWRLPSSEIALNVWKDTKKEGNSTVWINGEKSDLESAAWANCLLMHSILQDDTQESTMGHMGSLILPAAIATAEREGKGGEDLLTAIAAAYEVAGRISLKSGQVIVSRGFRGSPVFGPFAAAVAAGKLMGLTREQLHNAIALAANFSCGLLQASNTGSMEWRFQNGIAIRNGIMAAELARKGAPGAPGTLEGERGFFACFGGSELRTEILAKKQEIIETLGQDFEVARNIFKPYATCFFNQIGLDIVNVLAKQHHIDPKEVEEVKVWVAPSNKEYPGGDYQGPFNTIDQAVLSKPFSIAAALNYGDLTVDSYLSKLDDPELLNLAKKVGTTGVEGMGFLDTKVELRLKDGKVIAGDQDLVDMANYTLDRGRMADKFCRLTSDRLKKETAMDLVQLIFNLEEVSDLSEFSEKIPRA